MKLGSTFTNVAAKGGKLALAAAVTATLTMGAVSNSEAAERIRWKMPSTFSSNLPGLGHPGPWVADQLKTMSDGNIQIRFYEPGKLVPPFDILQAVSEGKTEAGYLWIGYDQGKVPATPLFAAVPFGLKPWAFTAWYYEGPGHEMVQEVYQNKGYDVHAELCGITAPETAGWYREPLTSLDQYKGMKIRFAGLGGKVLEKLGASVTMMPGGELFQALEKGTIDATEFSMPAVDSVIGFNKVVKNNLYPGWHQPFTAQYLLVNQSEWEKASEGQQRQIQVACKAATLQGLNESEWQNPTALAKLNAEGINTGQLPIEILEELQDVTQQVLAEEAAKDADFKRVWESQKEFEAIYNPYYERAYLSNELYSDEGNQ